MRSVKERIEIFLQSPRFGVVGASSNREKYGNKVLRAYQQKGRPAVPVNPKEKVIEGVEAVASVDELPEDVKSISIITPPPVTEQVVERALKKGIRNFWMQPGAESAKAVELCEQAGANVIADGTCALVVFGFRSHG